MLPLFCFSQSLEFCIFDTMNTPEQINLDEFLSEKADNHTFLAVLGRPISHSLSPLIHNFALRSINNDSIYYPILVPEGHEDKMGELFRHPNFRGANITIPLKQTVLKYVDQTSETALVTGAANTVYLTDEGNLRADNTDIDGFLGPLHPYKSYLYGKSALVFGSGGAAKAVIYALKFLGMQSIYIVSRNPDSLDSIDFKSVSYSTWSDVAQECVLMVNTTPVGMYPLVGRSPVDEDKAPLLDGKICYDLIYRPLETHFLKQAAEHGGTPINGLEMFLGQAAHSFRLFTHQEFPLLNVRTLVKEYFESRIQGTTK